ncbi:Sina domain containing protein [Asbolus verrucosus]|uniref:RING-type E3 ubiquitin transferase n=1 Tax=Asbolus verrucosus TaxID=1661398 RepID=A0A482WB72_ASBVE|nr:Sina domain containing protein [Asbolus verrucosus]
MIIKYNGENSQYKVKTKCLPFDAACNTNNGTKIRLITLNEIAENNGNITVTINLDVGESENVNEEVLKCLECPVCQQLMRPPIYQCTTGHSFCNICRTKLNECTTCRQPLSNTRNFSLEGFTAFVKYSCAYNQFGCNAIFAVNEISQHERSCEFKVYPCPISSCDYVAKYFAVKSHFKEMHNDCLVESTIYQGDFDPRYNCCTSETVKYLFEHCNIYKFTFKRSNEVCSFQVRILNDVDTNSKFFYVVSISDPERKQRKMTKSNLCLTRDVPITDYNVVSFLYSDLLSYRDFSNNDQIVYCCEIYEFKPVML